MSVGVTPYKKFLIVEMFQETGNKTKTGDHYGVSPRTVGRILNEYEWAMQNAPYDTIYKAMSLLVMPDNTLNDLLLDDDEMNDLDVCVWPSVFRNTSINHINEVIVDHSDTFAEIFARKAPLETEEDILPEDLCYTIEEDAYEAPEEAYDWNLIATAQSITVTRTDASGETESVEVAKGTDNFRKAWGILREVDMSEEEQVAIAADEIYAMADPKFAIERFSQGKLTVDVKSETVFFDGTPVNNSLTSRIIQMTTMRGVEGAQALINFLEKLMENPSYRAVNSLYDFLTHNDIEINSEGNFYAWKRVRDDYTDCHTGTIDNSVGSEPRMLRNLVDEDPNRTCSHGFHVAAKHYLPNFHGPITLKCEVDPRDVVAIPVDYNNSKMRTCGYKVVEDVTNLFEY